MVTAHGSACFGSSSIRECSVEREEEEKERGRKERIGWGVKGRKRGARGKAKWRQKQEVREKRVGTNRSGFWHVDAWEIYCIQCIVFKHCGGVREFMDLRCFPLGLCAFLWFLCVCVFTVNIFNEKNMLHCVPADSDPCMTPVHARTRARAHTHSGTTCTCMVYCSIQFQQSLTVCVCVCVVEYSRAFWCRVCGPLVETVWWSIKVYKSLNCYWWSYLTPAQFAEHIPVAGGKDIFQCVVTFFPLLFPILYSTVKCTSFLLLSFVTLKQVTPCFSVEIIWEILHELNARQTGKCKHM